jgi:hypothetical protein
MELARNGKVNVVLVSHANNIPTATRAALTHSVDGVERRRPVLKALLLVLYPVPVLLGLVVSALTLRA